MEREHKGVIHYIDSIGYHIQPDNDKYAVVAFPEDVHPINESNKTYDYEKLPEGFNLGELVKFVMAPGGIHAASMEKISEESQKND